MPEIRIFALPRGHLGANGVPLGKKIGSKPKKLPCPKIRIFGYPAPRSSIFGKKSKLRLWRQITVGTPEGSSWGQWGPIRSKKWVKTVKNYHAPKFEFLVIDFSQKIEVTVITPNHGGDPLGSILGPMGSHWVQKLGQNRKKLPCRKMSHWVKKNGSKP